MSFSVPERGGMGGPPSPPFRDLLPKAIVEVEALFAKVFFLGGESLTSATLVRFPIFRLFFPLIFSSKVGLRKTVLPLPRERKFPLDEISGPFPLDRMLVQ